MIRPRWSVFVYYAYRVTNSAGFYVPVAILFLTDRGFGLDFIGLSYAVYALATVASEIPSGYLGDRVGRRGSLAIGAALRVVVLGAYPLVESGAAYLLLHVVWAAGRTFKSGTADAWLYELLGTSGRTDAYASIESRGSTVLLVTSAGTAIAGGFLYGVDPGLPFFANAALAALGLPVLAVAPAGAHSRTGDGRRSALEATPPEAPSRQQFSVGDAVEVLRAQAARPSVRWLVVYLGVFYALFGVTRIYEQPALEAVGLSATSLGGLYAAFKLVSAGAAASVGWLESTIGTRRVFLLLIPAYGVTYASVAVLPALVVPALFLNRSLQIVTRPLRNQYLNDRLADVGRATALSGVAMAMALGSTAARLLAGAVVVHSGPVGLLPIAGAVAVTVAGAVWVATSPVRTPGERPGRAPTDGGAAAGP